MQGFCQRTCTGIFANMRPRVETTGRCTSRLCRHHPAVTRTSWSILGSITTLRLFDPSKQTVRTIQRDSDRKLFLRSRT